MPQGGISIERSDMRMRSSSMIIIPYGRSRDRPTQYPGLIATPFVMAGFRADLAAAADKSRRDRHVEGIGTVIPARTCIARGTMAAGSQPFMHHVDLRLLSRDELFRESTHLRIVCGVYRPARLQQVGRIRIAGHNRLRREPRWVFDRFHLKAPVTLADALPVHTSCSGSDGAPVSPSPVIAAIAMWDLLFRYPRLPLLSVCCH